MMPIRVGDVVRNRKCETGIVIEIEPRVLIRWPDQGWRKSEERLSDFVRVIPLDDMTWEKWKSLTSTERERNRAEATPAQMSPYLGWRVEVEEDDDAGGVTRRRFNVSISGGWRPVYLEMHNARSTGGHPCSAYRRVWMIRRIEGRN